MSRPAPAEVKQQAKTVSLGISERASIKASLEQAEQQLETGRAVFYKALELLSNPQEMYARGNEQVRTILNQAFFTKLYVNRRKITGQELREPFDVLMGVRGLLPTEASTRAYYRRSGALGRAQTDSRGTLLTEAAPERETLIDSIGLALCGQGSSKTVMVEVAGIEPASFGTSPGLLRAQPALLFSAPAVLQASRRRAQSL